MMKFNIEIVSDTVCPWCYVGKKQFDRAVKLWREKYPERNDSFEVVWKAFYLNPDMPVGGIDKQTYYHQKFGPTRTAQIQSRLSQIGSSVGIAFKYGGKTGNTRDSHRLIQLGLTKSPTTQSTVVSELFKKYFEEEGDITDHKVLREVGVRAGLDEREVGEWIDGKGNRGGKEVDGEVEEAGRRGVSGVPHFLVQGRFEVGGAQDSGVFLGLFEEIVGGEERGGVFKGESC